MANLVITSTTNSIKVDFGVLGVGQVPKKGTFHHEHIVSFKLEPADAYVRATTVGELEWQLSFNGVKGLQVDSINGVSPTSNSDLFDKLSALIA